MIPGWRQRARRGVFDRIRARLAEPDELIHDWRDGIRARLVEQRWIEVCAVCHAQSDTPQDENTVILNRPCSAHKATP